MTSAEALRRLGAEVVSINEGTSTAPTSTCSAAPPISSRCARSWAETGADVGIAHDGDAGPSVMLVDANGNEIDGDVVEAVCAIDLHTSAGCLPAAPAVSTVMCNLRLSHALRDAGIELVQTKVGDRYVLEAMREGGFVLGGEQSGHNDLSLEHNSTGDGLVDRPAVPGRLPACRFLHRDVASVLTRFPQTLINVRVNDKHAVDGNAAVQAAVEAAEAELGDSGRVLRVGFRHRAGGARVMVEGRQRRGRPTATRRPSPPWSGARGVIPAVILSERSSIRQSRPGL